MHLLDVLCPNTDAYCIFYLQYVLICGSHMCMIYIFALFVFIGYFAYMAATPAGLKGDKAHMRSSVWKESSARCKLSFWYYISEMARGIIRLFIKVND